MKILITSKQYPYYGGSATNAYKLIKFLRTYHNTCGLYFNNEDVNVDPENLQGIFRTSHNSKIFETKDNIGVNNVLKYLGGVPDIVLCFNYYVPIISKNIFPKSKIVYMVVGSPTLTLGDNCCINNQISANKFLKLENHSKYITKKFYDLEKKSIEFSDYILVDHGELALNILKKTFNDYFLKNDNYCYYDYSSVILRNEIISKQLNYENKKYDLIIISSNWTRPVKNKDFYYKIFSYYKKLDKIVIGKNSDYFKDIPNTTIVDLVEYNTVLKYLCESKLLLICSFFESGPNIIIEGIHCKCQILTSNNVGKSYILNDYNLTNDVYDIDEWITKINYILDNCNLRLPNINYNDNGFLNILNNILYLF